jgi:hypothetical protein
MLPSETFHTNISESYVKNTLPEVLANSGM